MTNRLTTAMRRKIERAVMAHRFTPQLNALQEKMAFLALWVYEDRLGKKKLAQIAEIPAGWLPFAPSVQARFGEAYYVTPFNGRFTSRYKFPVLNDLSIGAESVKVSVPIPANLLGTCLMDYPADHKRTDLFRSIMQEASGLEEMASKAATEVRVTLARFTTLDKLLDAWPEIKPFTQDLPLTPKVSLPAVTVKKLNETLGLPV